MEKNPLDPVEIDLDEALLSAPSDEEIAGRMILDELLFKDESPES